jgi:hypothetical protein
VLIVYYYCAIIIWALVIEVVQLLKSDVVILSFPREDFIIYTVDIVMQNAHTHTHAHAHAHTGMAVTYHKIQLFITCIHLSTQCSIYKYIIGIICRMCISCALRPVWTDFYRWASSCFRVNNVVP